MPRIIAHARPQTPPGKVFLVGAGPGNLDLLTLKAARLIANAEVLVYDRLVSSEILALAPGNVRRVDVGKTAGRHTLPQAEINRLLVTLARTGANVVRLKGGDPFIFGRGSEEALELLQHGISFEVVPGITSAQGCAASTLTPLTHRGLAHSVRYLTGHCKANEPLDLDWASLADPSTTLVVYMGLQNIDEITRELIGHGLPADTPTLTICQGTTSREVRHYTRLVDLPRMTKARTFDGPVLFIIGEVTLIGAQLSGVEHGLGTMEHGENDLLGAVCARAGVC